MKTIFGKTKGPEKNLSVILKKHSGRDSAGHVSVRHQGGRQKRYYRVIDFKRDKKEMVAEVIGLEKDPNRNAFIALVKYEDGENRYILYPKNLKIGDKIKSGDNVDIKIGYALPLKNIPLGIEVHNVEIYPGKGGKMFRSAGVVATIVAKEDKYVHLKLPSGEVKKFLRDCYATIGQVGNLEFKDEIIGSAGRKRLMGIRPTVRGVAQNPRSHPHGGGEGRSGEGMRPKTPWGKPARGKRTRHPKKWTNMLIVKRKN